MTVAELQLRTPGVADAGAIAAVCNALTGDLYGEGDVQEWAVRDWFEIRNLGMLVAERDGRVAGYVDVRRDEDGRRFPIDLRVPPEGRGLGIADALLEGAEGWARAHSEPGATARAYVAERDAEACAALEGRGYRPIRYSFTMEIELPEQLEPPQWPAGIEVRTLDLERDEEAVYECTQDSFSDHWDFRRIPIEEWRAFTVEREYFAPDLWWLAEDGDELAAVCLNAWHFSGDPAFGWIGTLGVRRPWRRRGLGLALLRHSFLDFQRRGATRVALSVDAENTTGAVRLYERSGMRQVRRYDTYEREL
jgi:mycothiol synthase